MANGGNGRHRRALNGWTVIWVGERAFRAPAFMKEQIEEIGFLVKIYRSHEKCCRALDKKPHIPSTNVFVVSQVDAEPLLAYLCKRNAADLSLVVDCGSASPQELTCLSTLLQTMDTVKAVLSMSWDEVLQALCVIDEQASMRLRIEPQQMFVPYCGTLLPPTMEANSAIDVDTEATASSAPGPPPFAAFGVGLYGGTIGSGALPAALPLDDAAEVAGLPWTLVWISDQAFKPAAAWQKMQLESLGGQIKKYKTHKNAARALDKKRALTRTVVLVSGLEAPPFLAYIANRPELAGARIVVEASARTVPLRPTPTLEVVEGFEAAVAAVRRAVADLGLD